MSEENVSQEFRLKNIDETRKNLVEEINWNELTSEKHRKVYRTLSYIENFIVASTITGCVSISAFPFLRGIPIGFTRSAIGLKVCPIAEGIKRY